MGESHRENLQQLTDQDRIHIGIELCVAIIRVLIAKKELSEEEITVFNKTTETLEKLVLFLSKANGDYEDVSYIVSTLTLKSQIAYNQLQQNS